MTTIRELCENKEAVLGFFAGQNLDAPVRLVIDPGDAQVLVGEPEAPKEGESTNG